MNLNPGTWQSVIRSVGLVLGGSLAYAGVISQTAVSDIVQKAVDAAPVVIQAIGVLGPLGLAIWGARTHTDTAVVQTAAAVTGAPVPIGPSADPALQKLAMDPTVPNVVVAPPVYTPINSGTKVR